MLTMEEAMRQTGAMPFAAGSIVKGTVIEVRPKEALVDIGYKSEGVISGSEFDDLKRPFTHISSCAHLTSLKIDFVAVWLSANCGSVREPS